MSLTYHQMTGDGDDFDNVTPYAPQSPVGHQDFEWARQALAMLFARGIEYNLGGDETPVVVASPGTFQRVRGSRRRTINFDNLGGLTKEAVFHYYTTDAGTSVQLRVRDLTNNETLAESTLSAATSLTQQVVELENLPAGNAVVELEFDASNAGAGVVAYGDVRAHKVP